MYLQRRLQLHAGYTVISIKRVTISTLRGLPSIVFNTSKPLFLLTRSGPAKFYTDNKLQSVTAYLHMYIQYNEEDLLGN